MEVLYFYRLYRRSICWCFIGCLLVLHMVSNRRLDCLWQLRAVLCMWYVCLSVCMCVYAPVFVCVSRRLRCWCRCAMMPRLTCGVSVPLSTSASQDELLSRLRLHSSWNSSTSAMLTSSLRESLILSDSLYKGKTVYVCHWRGMSLWVYVAHNRTASSAVSGMLPWPRIIWSSAVQHITDLLTLLICPFLCLSLSLRQSVYAYVCVCVCLFRMPLDISASLPPWVYICLCVCVCVCVHQSVYASVYVCSECL